MHEKLTPCPGAEDADVEARNANLLSAQSAIIDLAARLPARTPDEILYKLALWRWSAPDLDGGALEEGDALVYSVFRDLALMLGAGDVATSDDIETDFHRLDETNS